MNKVGGLTLSDFKTYYNDTVNSGSMQLLYRLINRSVEQNRIKISDSSSHIYENLIFDKNKSLNVLQSLEQVIFIHMIFIYI